jgi:hydrogenase maturation protease
MPELTMTNLLVIGYGNYLRGDDAVGRRLAEAMEAWRIPDIAVRTVHQLVPELVEDLQGAERVLFLDAVASAGEVNLWKIAAASGNQFLNHHCDAGGLLALTCQLYGRCPEGWLLTVPGYHFDLSEGISPGAQANMTKALALVNDFYQGTKEHA